MCMWVRPVRHGRSSWTRERCAERGHAYDDKLLLVSGVNWLQTEGGPIRWKSSFIDTGSSFFTSKLTSAAFTSNARRIVLDTFRLDLSEVFLAKNSRVTRYSLNLRISVHKTIIYNAYNDEWYILLQCKFIWVYKWFSAAVFHEYWTYTRDNGIIRCNILLFSK